MHKRITYMIGLSMLLAVAACKKEGEIHTHDTSEIEGHGGHDSIDGGDCEACDEGEQGLEGPQGPQGPQGVGPTGTIIMFAGETAPEGWLLCDGQEIDRSEYKELFDVVGTIYGVGDDVQTFNVPDLQGRTAIGAGAGVGLSPRELGVETGAEQHTLTVEEMPAHSHTGTTSSDGFHQPAEVSGEGLAFAWQATGGSYNMFQWYGNGTHSHSVYTNPVGGSQPHDIMQPSIALNYIIKD